MDSDANNTSSLYPPPPPYYKFFTKENIQKLPEYIKNKEKNSQHNNSTTTDDENNDTEEITSQLDFLIPPPIPKLQCYRGFGNVWQTDNELPDLESMGMTQLYKKEHLESKSSSSTVYQYKIKELHLLLKSLLLNYLEFIGILGINPEKYQEKVENIRTILVNIHHLLNQYRPHQSRESLIMLLENQVAFKRNEIKNIQDVCDKVREKLRFLQTTYLNASNSSTENNIKSPTVKIATEPQYIENTDISMKENLNNEESTADSNASDDIEPKGEENSFKPDISADDVDVVMEDQV